MGSEVSRGHLFENHVVEGLVRDQLLQPPILPLKLLQPLRLVEAQAAVFFPPAIVRLLADPQLLAHLRRAQAAPELHLSLPQLRDNLFRAVPLPESSPFLVGTLRGS